MKRLWFRVKMIHGLSQNQKRENQDQILHLLTVNLVLSLLSASLKYEEFLYFIADCSHWTVNLYGGTFLIMTMLCNDELSFIWNGPYPIILIIYNISHIMNITVYYIGKLLRVILRILITRKKYLKKFVSMLGNGYSPNLLW